MIYSTSAKYAVLACIELAARRDQKPVRVGQIAEATGISRHFLPKLVQVLVKAGVLASTKGRGGGIQFARSPSQVTISEIVEIIDGRLVLQDCMFGLTGCDGSRGCAIHPAWGPIRDQIIGFLENTTIADLVLEVEKWRAKSPV